MGGLNIYNTWLLKINYILNYKFKGKKSSLPANVSWYYLKPKNVIFSYIKESFLTQECL